jgi:hypothetical protein
MNKISMLIAGIITISFVQPSSAQPILDSQSRQIIYSRICNAYSTNRYTIKELFSYAQGMVEANAHLSKPFESSSCEGFGVYTCSVAELKNLANERIVVMETRDLLNAAIKDKRCQN